MTWLQGGPFLEISFLLTLELDRHSLADNILTTLQSFKPAVDFATTETELKEKVSEFEIGYLDNDKDPTSKVYHQTQIPIYVDIDGKRKSILSLRQVSNKFIAVDFWFFGSELDAPEWNQQGITIDQLPFFQDFLNILFDRFDFVIGTVGYEVSVTDLFVTNETWPNEKYNLDNINKQSLQVDNYFSLIIANKKYVDLHGTNGVFTTGQKQTLGKEKYST
ncbi:hypothetical protein [Pedobacter sp. UBA4863]|uniref:hypothetical protein n=1 Tax=Pedobacter sp. UBA4863 TaxID=1947060 RepID=UPI0025D2DF26|nr:hypothetical protein [Pedobacter sp. UBA4863]